jgi:16S rRNA (cytosine967-C5)-methyltransferase
VTKSTREIALDILIDITENSSFSHMVINRALGQYQQLEKQDRAFITRICEGTIERLITIDYVINLYSSVKVNKMKPFIRNLLRMSVYQIKYMESIPDSAACNEAVKLAKKRGFTSLSGFVNGVLRNIIRNPEKIVFPDELKEPMHYLSVVYSTPEWLVKDWLKQFDYNIVKNMLEASFQDKPTTIRCNLNQITVNDLQDELVKSGVTVNKGAYLPYALQISGYNYLNDLETFKKGNFQIQDESSMLVGQISGVKNGDNIIDVCAAPGGKSLHIAEKLNGTGHVDARDVSDLKINLIRENINRLKFTNISVKVHDALVLDEGAIEKADVVIADLPCSGLGVIGKKPDIKYNMTKVKQQELVKLQRDILTVVQQYVKQKGILLYSTCTVNQEENLDNVRWFIKNFNFELESIEDYLPESLRNETTKEGYLQLIPEIHHTDGFFIARLRKL